MNRTASVSGLIVPALMAVLGAAGCDDPFCVNGFTECGRRCVSLPSDPGNCGACGATCADGAVCVDGGCECPSGTQLCGTACVDVLASALDCGACGNVCAAMGECVAGQCRSPLAAMRTIEDFGKGFGPRDLYVLEDVSYDLTQINAGDTRVLEHVTLPDGRVVMVADSAQGTRELYVVDRSGPTKLNAPLVANGEVFTGLALSPDGTKLLYRADGDTDGVAELYAVGLNPPVAARKVNAPLTVGGEVGYSFAISNTGRIAYVANEDDPAVYEAYTTDLTTAGESTKLNPALGMFESVTDLQITANGTHVVYRDNNSRLAVVAIASPGTAAAVADGGEGVGGYQIAPDNQSVVFTTLSLRRATFASPGTADNVLVDLFANGQVFSDFLISRDGAYVYFRQSNGYPTRARRVLIANPAMIDTLSTDETVGNGVREIALSKGGASLAFSIDGGEGIGYAGAVYTVDVRAGSNPAPGIVTNEVPADTDGIYPGLVPLDDGRVLFLADIDRPFSADAYISQAGTSPVKIGPDLDEKTAATDVAIITGF